MSNIINRKNQNLRISKRNDFIYKKKIDKTSISNNNIINSNINNILNHCLSKTTKNSPRTMNSSKLNKLRNKSFNFKNLSKQVSKSNLRIENSLDSTGGLKKLKLKTKKINLNIKTINMNLEIKKYPYETINDNLNQNDLSFIQNKDYNNIQDKIYEILNKKIYKKDNSFNITNNNNFSNIKEKKNNNFFKNLNRINTSIYRPNKSKDQLNKEKISPIKAKVKCLSIKKKKESNMIKKNDILFNSLKNNFFKKASNKKQKYNDNNISKIKQKRLIKEISKNVTPKNNNEKLKINNKTKFNEISFNNIPKIFQFNNSNNKKQTRNINYHKKQPSLSLTKTSNISQCNFTETNSLDNMSNQITINKNQNTLSNYNNSTTISNDKSIQYNNAISMYNKLIKDNNELIKENNELKQYNYNLNQQMKKCNIKLNVLKFLLNNIILIYKNNVNNIINKYKEKENEMKNNLKNYNEYIKKIIFYHKYYSLNEINKNKKISNITQQILIENKILRNLYNNLLLFDINNARLYTNQSDNNTDPNEYKDNIKISYIMSNRSNKFFEDDERDEKKLSKRSDTAEQKKCDALDIIGVNHHPQSRNYNNKNELNTDLINGNKLLKKCFIRKINYKIKK